MRRPWQMSLYASPNKDTDHVNPNKLWTGSAAATAILSESCPPAIRACDRHSKTSHSFQSDGTSAACSLYQDCECRVSRCSKVDVVIWLPCSPPLLYFVSFEYRRTIGQMHRERLPGPNPLQYRQSLLCCWCWKIARVLSFL